VNLIALSLAGFMSYVAVSQPALTPQTKGLPEDALVLVEGHSPDHASYSYGVVTGDGSFILCSSLIRRFYPSFPDTFCVDPIPLRS